MRVETCLSGCTQGALLEGDPDLEQTKLRAQEGGRHLNLDARILKGVALAGHVLPLRQCLCLSFSSQVQIQSKKVDISKVSSKCGSKANIKHKPGESLRPCVRGQRGSPSVGHAQGSWPSGSGRSGRVEAGFAGASSGGRSVCEVPLTGTGEGVPGSGVGPQRCSASPALGGPAAAVGTPAGGCGLGPVTRPA